MENRISIPKGGLKKSIDPRNLSSNDITHALNTTLFDTDGDFYDISYEKSNILATKFPDGYVIIGRINRLKNNYTYYFLTNPLTGNSLFGYVDNSANYDDSITEDNLENVTQTPYKTFNILLDDSCAVYKLKLSELHPIQNIVLKEEKTGAVIYFTDFINPSRHIEIDNIQKYFTEEVPCDDDIDIPCPDVSKMRIHKLYLLPKIDDVMVSSGGSLERGTYSFLIALSDAMGNEVSEYTSITQPISIWDNINETTDKAIRLIVNDLDPDYTHYKVVVLFNQHLDNAQSTRLVGVFPNTNKEVIVSNIGNLERISYETVTYVNVRVTNSENLTSFNNQLAEYGLVYERELNLQPVVNMIGSYLKWQTHVAKEDLYSYPEMQYKYTGINRNEVVPYSIRFLKKGGSTTALFPLVGREANAIDLQEINNLDVESLETGISCGDNLRTQRWKLYNTATVEEGCGTPEDFIEIEELYTWTCTDNDTARTGPGSLTITDEYSEFTSLEDYYETNGCFANLCETLNQNLVSQVACDNSPCNNNPQLIDSQNFIADEIGLRITDLYGGNSLGEYVSVQSDEYYDYVPEVGIVTGNTITYPSGTFQERFWSRASPFVSFSGMPEFWYRPAVMSLIVNPMQLIGTQGFIAPHIKNSGVIKSISKIYDGHPVYYKPSNLGAGEEQARSWHRADITKELILRVLMNSKFETPIPSEYINYNDLRIIVQVNDNGFPTSGGTANTSQFNNNSIIWTGILSDYADKNIVLRPTDIVKDGVELVVMSAGGVVEGTFMSTKPHINRQVSISLQFGNIEIDGETLQLSPRASFYPYFEEPSRIGQLIEWDDIVIGTTVNYKDICTTLEPVVKACEAVPWQKGSFSYWESGLQYPDNPELYDSSKLEINVNDIPQQYRAEFQQLFTNGVSAGQYQIKDSFNLTCKPIRHFKFPDNKVAPFIQNTTLTPFSETYIYPLGVTIDENIINMFLDIAVKNNLLTQEERDEIYSYELFRGDLSTNRSVVASGLLYDTRQYTEKEKTVEYLNYPYNSYSADHLNPDSKIKDGFGQRGSNFGFHSPETDYYSPTIPTELNIQGYQFGFSKGYFDEVEGHPKMVVLSPKAYSTASTLATIEVIAEAAITSAQAYAGSDSTWFVAMGGLGSTGTGTNSPSSIPKDIVALGILAIMSLEGVVYNYARYRLQWQETMKNLGQQRNFAHYYFSEGSYNYLKTDQTEGHIVRGIHFGKKIKDSRYTITDTVDRDKVELNNIDREYTTFLKLGDDYAIDYPSSYSGYDRESITFSSNEGENNEGKSDQIQKKIASPYAQLVNSNPTLHGQIDSITWLYTGYRGDLEYPQSGCLPIFGGDTYITRHTFKRKIPLFLTTAMGQSNMTPFDYKVTNNIGKTPRFYVSYDATSEFDKGGNIFPQVVSDYHFDSQTQRGNYIVPPSKFYLYYYGVPSFLTETRINTHYREFGREPGDNFYPNVGDLGWWTQERNVSIRTPNYYKYSKTYSNQVNVFNHRSLRQTYKQDHQNILDRSVNGVIFSLPDNNENGQIDPWLKFRPLDAFEFETKYGELKELKGIENESILARFEHTAIIYNKVQTTVDDGTNPTVRLGGKDIFQRRTASFVNSELGFGGTQQAESLSCEYGHFYTDTKRGQVIQIPSGGGNMIEISNNNSRGEMTFMRDWFKRNLPFKILNSNIQGIQELNVDNNYNGVGISLGYDSQHRRILITKKDYLPLDPCIEYSRELGFYTTCGTNVEYSCPPGYTFNPDNITCEREIISNVCPTGYEYNSANNTCFKDCDVRIALVLDNYGQNRIDWSIEYFKVLLNSLTGNATISFYNLYGSNIIVQEDLNVSQALVFLNTYSGQTSTEYNITEVTCVAGQWLNQNESVERVLHIFNYVAVLPTPDDFNCVDSQTVGSVSTADYYKSTGVVVSGNGDVGELNNEGFFTEDMWFTEVIPTQSVVDFFMSLSCDEEVEVPVICDCEIEDEQCVCVQTVPPIVSNTEKVFVCDETKFKDVGWTISYDPSSGMFHSFMDYKPNFYTSMQGYFEAGKNCLGASTWAHGITNRSYGVFFGNKFPMEVETITKGSLREYTGNVELLTEAKRYQSELDFTINPDITFNKSVIYNRRECSGQMMLDLVKGSLAQYPITTTDYQRIPITKTESTFNYNYFFDRVDRTNMSPFIVNDENQIKITLDNINFRQRAPLPRINGDWFYNRLTYDTDTKLNLTLKLQKSLTNLDKL